MKAIYDKYGPWALVTGASSGIGAEFARQLGAHRLNLVLVARRMNRLQKLAELITAEHNTEVRPIECDLSKPDFWDKLGPQLKDVDIGLLVNNAGFSNTGAVIDNEMKRELELLDVNCRAYLILAHELGIRLKARGRGGIIFVSSTVAFAPAALWAHYSASKAYELALGEAMHEEMRQEGVDVLVVCPGPTRTEFYDVSNQDLAKTPRNLRFLIVDPPCVVATALRGIGKKRSVVVGWGNKLVTQVGRILPRRVNSKNVGSFVMSVRQDQPGSSSPTA